MKCECSNLNKECETCLDNPNLMEQLEPEKKQILLNWILSNLEKRRTFNHKKSSYALKHKFEESESGFYISNGVFKGAMVTLRYEHKQGQNWHFKIK